VWYCGCCTVLMKHLYCFVTNEDNRNCLLAVISCERKKRVTYEHHNVCQCVVSMWTEVCSEWHVNVNRSTLLVMFEKQFYN
jgi:hypothetical protein